MFPIQLFWTLDCAVSPMKEAGAGIEPANRLTAWNRSGSPRKIHCGNRWAGATSVGIDPPYGNVVPPRFQYKLVYGVSEQPGFNLV